MKISRKLKKRLVQKPRIRLHIIKSLVAFDREINQHQNINWSHPSANHKISRTLSLLRFLVKHMDSNNHFQIQQGKIIKKLHLNQSSYNFNFSALYQLKMIKIDWNSFKFNHEAEGTINTQKVF